MASIAKRPDGRWRARYRDEAGKEHAKHFDRKVDAQRWLDEVTTSVVTGTYVDPRAGRLTFAMWFDQWSARQAWAGGTLEAASTAAKSVPFANVPMGLLRPSHVQAWVSSMQSAGLARSTTRTRLNYVSMALRAAVADRVIAHDPSARIRPPRARRAEAAMTLPEPAQVRAALGVADELFAPFLAVCAFAGLRLGEAAGLQLGDVDFMRRVLRVRRQVQGATRSTAHLVPPKNDSERDVPVPGALLQILSEHVRARGLAEPGQALFRDVDGHLFNRNSAAHLWRGVRSRVSLDACTLHDLRHFYASGLIAGGLDVVAVQRALGHSSPTITLGVYAHLWPSAEDRTRAAAADLAGEVLAAAADRVRTGGVAAQVSGLPQR